MPLPPEHLDKVMSELVAVSRSAMSKREEAANLARIWGGADDGAGGHAAAGPRPAVTVAEVAAAAPQDPDWPAPDRARRRARWRGVA